jgi:hypothetical protein
MENTGGEPDVVSHDKKTDEFLLWLRYWKSTGTKKLLLWPSIRVKKKIQTRKQCSDVAAAMGILTEAEYKELQQLGNFDTKRQVG